MRIHFFYIYSPIVLLTSIFTTWMFFSQQWLFMSLIVIAYTMLMAFMLYFLLIKRQQKEHGSQAVQKAGSSSFVSASPITPMPPSISKSAALSAYYTQRYALKTPLPEAPLIRVLETVNLKEQ